MGIRARSSSRARALASSEESGVRAARANWQANRLCTARAPAFVGIPRLVLIDARVHATALELDTQIRLSRVPLPLFRRRGLVAGIRFAREIQAFAFHGDIRLSSGCKGL